MNAPKTAVIIQARMGSSRLPGKVLRVVEGRTVLEHLLVRIGKCRNVFTAVVATTDQPGDAPIEALGRELGVPVHRGSEHDVLARYRDAAAAVDADVIVRVTGDCPLISAGELDRVIDLFVLGLNDETPWDYVTNQAGAVRRIPRGLDVEVFSRAALNRAAAESVDPGDREHVTPYLYREPGRFRTLISHPETMDLGHLRLTIDTPEDLALFEALLRELGPDAQVAEVAALMAQRPDLMAMNAEIVQRSTESEAQQRQGRIAGRLLLGRADRSAQMGSGHVARLSSLLAAWVAMGGRARIVGQALEGFWAERMGEHGIEIEAGNLDAAAFVQRAEVLGAAALALDGYQYDAAYTRHAAANFPTLMVDDLAVYPQSAHVVLNQNLGFDAARYTLEGESRLLIGEKYVLLRPEFWERQARPADAERRLVVSFGSSDPAQMTVPLVRALLESAGPTLEIVVVVGPAIDEESRVALAEMAAMDKAKRLILRHNVQNMAAIFRSARTALIAAGTTTWEVLACAAVPVAVQVADNQAVVAEGLVAHDAGVDLGWHKGCDPAECARSVLSLIGDTPRLDRMEGQGGGLVDGRGVWRAIDALLDVMDRWEAPS